MSYSSILTQFQLNSSFIDSLIISSSPFVCQAIILYCLSHCRQGCLCHLQANQGAIVATATAYSSLEKLFVGLNVNLHWLNRKFRCHWQVTRIRKWAQYYRNCLAAITKRTAMPARNIPHCCRQPLPRRRQRQQPARQVHWLGQQVSQPKMALYHRSRDESSFHSFTTGTSSKPNTLGIAESPSTSPPPIKPSPVNILEVEVDEEAFKETSPVCGHLQ